ncbi:uncharacterized protein LODBEIA_P12810 [Lodderomyces beijingensis]|uniref:Glycoside hydrolase family 5 domain-containing protein n=1 Tax=Lodderomyces beijingensis TaxID=1775926 RepID=A0ABP0ZHY5_9ASCO
MQQAFSKLKLKSKASDAPDAAPAVESGKAPTTKQIYQARFNFGVNFGSCFVLEKWIFHDLFSETDGDTEFDAVSSLVKKIGVEETQKKFENHWNSYVTQDDWNWLAAHEVASIRLPIGYWDVDGGSFTGGYKFGPYKKVYANAWTTIKKFIEAAAAQKISVLIDIHAVPGGANDSGHSGEPNADGAFWSDDKAQNEIAKMAGWIANDLKGYDNIAGIEVVNEASFENNPKKQQRYYGACLTEIRKSDEQVPVVISDGWWPDQWVKWVQSEQGEGYLGVVVDDHVYRCFSDADKAKSPKQIIDDLNGDVLTNLNDSGAGVDFIVGEWSCVIDSQSWEKGGNRDEDVKQFGQTESKLFNVRAAGSYFWTFKFQSGNGGEWDFKTMFDKGDILPPPKPSKQPSEDELNQAATNAADSHQNYWKQQKTTIEPEVYKGGFVAAWKDADAFAKFNGSRIGRKEALKWAALQGLIKSKGGVKNTWEFSQGYDEGLKQFYSAAV